MKLADKVVGVLVEGEITEWHVVGGNAGGPDYDTLCGLDANDPTLGLMGTVEPKRGQKVTCAQCFIQWRSVITLRMRMSDFATEAMR